MQKDMGRHDFSTGLAQSRDNERLTRLWAALHRLPTLIKELTSTAVSGLGIDEETAAYIVQDLMGRCTRVACSIRMWPVHAACAAECGARNWSRARNEERAPNATTLVDLVWIHRIRKHYASERCNAEGCIAA